MSAGEKNLEMLCKDIQDRIKRSGDLLVSDTNKNLRSKHDKFLAGIEKFVALKIKLLLRQLQSQQSGLDEQDLSYEENNFKLDVNTPYVLKDKLSYTDTPNEDMQKLPPKNSSRASNSRASSVLHSRKYSNGKSRINSGSPAPSSRSVLIHSESQILRDAYTMPESDSARGLYSSPVCDGNDRTMVVEDSQCAKTTSKVAEKEMIKLLAKQHDKVVEAIKEHTATIVEELIERRFQSVQKAIIAEVSKVLTQSAFDIKEQVDYKYQECWQMHQQNVQQSSRKRKGRDAQVQTSFVQESTPEPASSSPNKPKTSQTDRSMDSSSQRKKQLKKTAPDTTLDQRRQEYIRHRMNEHQSKSPVNNELPSPLHPNSSRSESGQSPTTFTFRKHAENKLKKIAESNPVVQKPDSNCMNNQHLEQDSNQQNSSTNLLKSVPSKWSLKNESRSSQECLHFGRVCSSANSLLELFPSSNEIPEIKFIERRTSQGVSFYVPASNSGEIPSYQEGQHTEQEGGCSPSHQDAVLRLQQNSPKLPHHETGPLSAQPPNMLHDKENCQSSATQSSTSLKKPRISKLEQRRELQAIENLELNSNLQGKSSITSQSQTNDCDVDKTHLMQSINGAFERMAKVSSYISQ